MNPPPPQPPPFTNPSSYTFLQPTIPNHHNPPSNSLLPQNHHHPPPSSDLPTTLYTLKNLLHLSHRALDSLSNLLSPKHPILISCPFNPHHRMPPPSLFRHSLQCPSPLDLDTDIKSLRYPHTLAFSPQSQHHHHHQNYSNSEELCFSLADYYGGGGSNFFYRDCPGVFSSYSSHDQDSAANLMFTLPGVLSVECANFVAKGNGDRERIDCFVIDCVGEKLLASDFWAIWSEVEMWSDYPSKYSYVVLSAAAVMCSRLVDKEIEMKRWVIVNSPRYGVVIDEAMRDHIFLLFRLGLKAIVREAFGSAETIMNGEANEKMSKMNLKSMTFKCPVLVQALKWLASQLSFLYGEVNGKMFAINMFKQCLLSVARDSLLITMEKKETESKISTEVTQNLIAIDSETEGAKLEYTSERSDEHGLYESDNRATGIFVYQVAAAVAALHERALLEEKIKALRRAQPVTKYQIVAEHAYVSKKAEEERQKRSNYRSILEHDGLLLHRSYNQETNKTKTREELLAEERDYKRRRMSYHGKKLKRTRTQVMRDIIDEYMEEIKKAGGIGCFVKGSEGGMLPSEPYSVQDDTPDKIRSMSNLSDVSTEMLHGYRKQSYSGDNVKSFQSEKSFSKDYEQNKQHSRGHSKHPENLSRNISRNGRTRSYDTRSPDGRTRIYDTRSPDGRGSRVWLDEQSNCRREHNDTSKHDEDSLVSPNVSKFHDTRSLSSTSGSVNNSYARRNTCKLETKATRRRNTYRSQTSDSVVENTFDDRYDPSESHHDYSEES